MNTTDQTSLRFRCTHCHALLAIAPSNAGKLVSCPKCRQKSVAPAPAAANGDAAPAEPLQAPAAAAENRCPACGSKLLEGAVACMDCGYLLESDSAASDAPPTLELNAQSDTLVSESPLTDPPAMPSEEEAPRDKLRPGSASKASRAAETDIFLTTYGSDSELQLGESRPLSSAELDAESDSDVRLDRFPAPSRSSAGDGRTLTDEFTLDDEESPPRTSSTSDDDSEFQLTLDEYETSDSIDVEPDQELSSAELNRMSSGLTLDGGDDLGIRLDDSPPPSAPTTARVYPFSELWSAPDAAQTGSNDSRAPESGSTLEKILPLLLASSKSPRSGFRVVGAQAVVVAEEAVHEQIEEALRQLVTYTFAKPHFLIRAYWLWLLDGELDAFVDPEQAFNRAASFQQLLESANRSPHPGHRAVVCCGAEQMAHLLCKAPAGSAQSAGAGETATPRADLELKMTLAKAPGGVLAEIHACIGNSTVTTTARLPLGQPCLVGGLSGVAIPRSELTQQANLYLFVNVTKQE